MSQDNPYHVTGHPWRVINGNLYHGLSWIYKPVLFSWLPIQLSKRDNFYHCSKGLRNKIEKEDGSFQRTCLTGDAKDINGQYHFPLKLVPNSFNFTFPKNQPLPELGTLGFLTWQSSIINQYKSHPFSLFHLNQEANISAGTDWLPSKKSEYASFIGQIALPCALLYNTWVRWFWSLQNLSPNWAFRVLLRC